MDPKAMRKTIDSLLVGLEQNPRVARRSTLVRRYGRPLGLSLALGLGGLVGCGDGSSGSNNKDAKPAVLDGPVVDGPSQPDLPLTPDARDALPPSVDLYGADVPLLLDAKDAPAVEGGGVDLRQRDVPSVDLARDRGTGADRVGDRAGVERGPGVDFGPRIDTRKADAPEVDGGPADAEPVDADQAG